MNQSKIFLCFKEPMVIHKEIENMKVPGTLNEKIKAFMSEKARAFIKYYTKILDYNPTESQIYTLPYLPRYLFMVIFTKTNVNHPYLLYVNMDDDILNFLITSGREDIHADLSDYATAITSGTKPEITAIRVLVESTIYVRKVGILTSQFKILKCENIANCVKKINEIDKENITEVKKKEMKHKYSEYYLNKAVELLKHYFEILDTKDYYEAYSFLKGGNGSYFGKERLNTFFKNNQSIIGHLEIFIPMYQLLHDARMKLLK